MATSLPPAYIKLTRLQMALGMGRRATLRLLRVKQVAVLQTRMGGTTLILLTDLAAVGIRIPEIYYQSRR